MVVLNFNINKELSKKQGDNPRSGDNPHGGDNLHGREGSSAFSLLSIKHT
ncbi:MAG: hypothetical protein LBD23_18025 [Oscillospiraceae bacterium]|jgi:hypothetical protein|nr:hypothetical protein [Oscillospiraceae bacterium]